MNRALHLIAVGLLLCPRMFAQQTGDSKSPAEPQAANSGEASSVRTGDVDLQDSVKAEPVKIVKALYPEAARQRRMQGQVWVKVLITENGDVEKAETISGDPLFADSALAAAKQWKFKPFIRNGHPVKVSTKIAFDFAFSSKVRDIPIQPSAGLPAHPDKADGSKRVEVSPGVVQGMLMHQVAPVYPDQAKRYGIQGSVVLKAMIGRDGRIADLTAISGPPELIPAAISAVQQWRYRPYTLNGEPVAVQTTITVNFKLSRR
jgi:TonB family protein